MLGSANNLVCGWRHNSRKFTAILLALKTHVTRLQYLNWYPELKPETFPPWPLRTACKGHGGMRKVIWSTSIFNKNSTETISDFVIPVSVVCILYLTNYNQGTLNSTTVPSLSYYPPINMPSKWRFQNVLQDFYINFFPLTHTITLILD